jgi:hypothetical protein
MSSVNDELAKYSCIKLEGARVDRGYVTISDMREVLSGIEHAAKYFISTEYPEIKKDSYELEVRVESGSLFLYVVGLAFTGGAGVAAAFGISYAKKAGEKLAENDIGEKTTADIIRPAVQKMKSTVRIAKHLGGMGKQRTFPEAKIISPENIVLPNAEGEELRVTKAELDAYARAPRDTFKKMAAVVDAETTVAIFEPGEVIKPNNAAVIDTSSKAYFNNSGVDDNGVVFPEMQHGEYVTLRGSLCRANKNTGTLGFEYRNHTLTSYLHQMEIRDIKDSLFDKEVEVEAVVIRNQQKMDAEDELKRPKLEIRRITTIGDLELKPPSLELNLD